MNKRIERGLSGLGGFEQMRRKIRLDPLNPPNPRSILESLNWSNMRSKPIIAGTVSGLITFVLLAATSAGVGVVWDEPIYVEATERAARWFGLIFSGQFGQAFEQYTFGISWGLVHEHPPLFRYVNALGWTLTRDWLPAPLHHRIGSIAVAALTVGILVGVIWRVRGARTALFAAAALLSMPRIFFHMHLTVLDFPLAAMWIVGTLVFFNEVSKTPPVGSVAVWRPSLRSAFVIGAWIGLGLLTKINAVLLLPFWGLWLLIYRRSWRMITTFALSLLIGLAVLIAGWPWIWGNPLTGLWNWVQFFRVHFEIRQWFAGQLYVETPWTLPWLILLITTPLLVWLMGLIGALVGRKHAENRRSGVLDEWIGLHLLGLAVVVGYYAFSPTPIHDQDRLLLPAFVHLAILSGEGFNRLWGWLGARLDRPLRGAVAQTSLAILLLLPGIVQNVRLHPYQLAYYGEVVGGVRGAARLDMETIYFASTYVHFLPALNQLPANALVWVMPNSWDVLYYYQKVGLLRADLVILRPPGWGSFYDDQGVPSQQGTLADADFALIERRQTTFNDELPEHAIQLTWAADAPELDRLSRNGVVLATLHRRPD
jgi:4-amino-4-deoxy-L-arabinose transferase-like glycosyltransferase